MATATQTKVDTLPILRGGKWIEPKASRFGDVFNPSTGQVIAPGAVLRCEADGRRRRSCRSGAAGLGGGALAVGAAESAIQAVEEAFAQEDALQSEVAARAEALPAELLAGRPDPTEPLRKSVFDGIATRSSRVAGPIRSHPITVLDPARVDLLLALSRGAAAAARSAGELLNAGDDAHRGDDEPADAARLLAGAVFAGLDDVLR